MHWKEKKREDSRASIKCHFMLVQLENCRHVQWFKGATCMPSSEECDINWEIWDIKFTSMDMPPQQLSCFRLLLLGFINLAVANDMYIPL